MLPRPGAGYTRHVVKLLPPVLVENLASKKETYGRYNTAINVLFAPYFRQYPFLWEELLGFESWRTERIFQFPNGANLAQVTALAANYLQQLVETSWEDGRDDATLADICRGMREVANISDPRFQTYPFQSPRKIRRIQLDLDRTSVLNVFRQLFEFLVNFPASIGAIKGDPKTFKAGNLPEEQKTTLVADLGRLQGNLT
jgi:hypothetical protein